MTPDVTQTKTALCLSLKSISENHPEERGDALALLSLIQSHRISASDMVTKMRALSASITKRKDLDNEELESTLKNVVNILNSIKRNSNASHSQVSKIDEINIENSTPAMLLKQLAQTCKEFANEIFHLRGESSLISKEYQSSQNIILGDINWSSKQIIKSLTPLYNQLKKEYTNDTQTEDISKQLNQMNQRSTVNFFEAIKIMERGLRNLTRVHGKKHDTEAMYLKTFHAHLKGMHGLLSKTISENESLTTYSEKEKEVFDTICNGFKEASENEKNPDTLRKIIHENVEHMNQSFKKIVSRQTTHIRQQQRKLGALRSEGRSLQNKAKVLLQERDDLSLALANIEEISNIDSLTGIKNRRAYDIKFKESESALASGTIKNIGFIVIDIDHFKSINDNYGHDVGDAVLSKFSSYINNFLKSTAGLDLFRYGGEEFVAILSNTTLKEAVIKSEELRKKLKHISFEGQSIKLSVTASIGISVTNTPPLLSAFKKADSAMYHSKQSGRDQVSFLSKEKLHSLKRHKKSQAV